MTPSSTSPSSSTVSPERTPPGSTTAGRPLTVITGGTRGIGAAVAERLYRAGHDLVLGFHTDAEAAAAFVESLTAGAPRADDAPVTAGRHAGVAPDAPRPAAGTNDSAATRAPQVMAVRADLTTDRGIDELFTSAAALGRVTGVVNNAGATIHVGALVDTPAHVVREVIDLNLTAAVLVARRAVLEMRVAEPGSLSREKHATGVLVNISSAAATTGAPGEYVHYAAAKAGIDALTKGLALEAIGSSVRVLGVAPGTVETRIHADAGVPERTARVASAHPMGRVATPEEIATVVEFALSDAASYVVGETIRVAGGR